MSKKNKTKKKKEKILIAMMGGTIDSRWEGKLDTAVINKKSALPEFFKSLILYLSPRFIQICMKDSRAVTQADLLKLAKAIDRAPENKIIITHGTYTMPDTAKFLSAYLKRKDKIIILTGSMVPLAGFEGGSSDAGFNLGYAIAAVGNLSPGVYLAMNGRLFRPNEVAKSLAEGKFYSVFDQKQ